MSSSYSDSDCNCGKCHFERQSYKKREKKCEKCIRYERINKCNKCDKCIKREREHERECVQEHNDTKGVVCKKALPIKECPQNDTKYVVITINSFGQNSQEIAKI
jgi:hypothetical protein